MIRKYRHLPGILITTLVCLAQQRDRSCEVDIFIDVDHVGADLVGLVVHIIDRALGHIRIADKQIVIPVSIRADDRTDICAAGYVFSKIDLVEENQSYRFIVRMQLDRRTR